MQVRFGELIKLYKSKKVKGTQKKAVPVSKDQAYIAKNTLDTFISHDQNNLRVQKQGGDTYSLLLNKTAEGKTDYYLLTNGPFKNTIDDYRAHITGNQKTFKSFLEEYTKTHQLFLYKNKEAKWRIKIVLTKPGSEHLNKKYSSYGADLIQNQANSKGLVRAFSYLGPHYGDKNKGYGWIKADRGTYYWVDIWRNNNEA